VAEVGLLAGHVPFDAVTALDAGELERYAALVLPDTECMSDAKCDTRTGSVHAGGGAALTGSTSKYNERRRRPRPGLDEMLSVAE